MSTAAQEMIDELRLSRQRVLAVRLLRLATASRLSPEDQRVLWLVPFISILLLLVVVFVGVSLLLGDPIRGREPYLLISALTSALSIYVVAWCLEYTTGELRECARLRVVRQQTSSHMMRRTRALTAWPAQLAFSVGMTALFLLLVGRLSAASSLGFVWVKSNYICSGVTVFWVTHGGYWALTTPSIARRFAGLKPSELGVFPFDPGNSPLLHALSRIYSAYALWCALLVTLLLIGVLSLEVGGEDAATWWLVSLVLIGYLLTAWVFVYPQIVIATIVRRAKDEALSNLQSKIAELCRDLEPESQEKLAHVGMLMQLHDHVVAARGSLVTMRAARAFLGSIVAPTLVAVLGRWIELPK